MDRNERQIDRLTVDTTPTPINKSFGDDFNLFAGPKSDCCPLARDIGSIEGIGHPPAAGSFGWVDRATVLGGVFGILKSFRGA